MSAAKELGRGSREEPGGGAGRGARLASSSASTAVEEGKQAPGQQGLTPCLAGGGDFVRGHRIEAVGARGAGAPEAMNRRPPTSRKRRHGDGGEEPAEVTDRRRDTWLGGDNVQRVSGEQEDDGRGAGEQRRKDGQYGGGSRLRVVVSAARGGSTVPRDLGAAVRCDARDTTRRRDTTRCDVTGDAARDGTARRGGTPRPPWPAGLLRIGSAGVHGRRRTPPSWPSG